MTPQDKKELNFILTTAIKIIIAMAITITILYITLKLLKL